MRTHSCSSERSELVWLYAGPGGDFSMALTLARAAVERAPNEAKAHHTLGWVYYRNGLQSLAIDAFRRSVEKDPTNPIYLRHLALAYAKAGDWASSKHFEEKAARLTPRCRPRFGLDCVGFQD